MKKMCLFWIALACFNVGCSDSDDKLPEVCVEMLAVLDSLKTNYPDYPRMEELTAALSGAGTEMQQQWQQANSDERQRIRASCEKNKQVLVQLSQFKQ